MSDLFKLEPTDEPAAPVAVAIRWVPEFLVDEVSPEPRETPDHWLKAVEGGWVVGDEEATRDISIGETMVFSGFQEFGSVELTIRLDGTFDIAGSIDSRATLFSEVGEPDTLVESIADFVCNAMGFLSAEETTFLVETYRWDDTTFGLVEGIEGATFVPVEAEPAEAAS